MKTRKDKNNNRSILVCTVSILLALGMMTGCSVQDSAPSEVQSDPSFSSGESAAYSNEAAEDDTWEPDNIQTTEDIVLADSQEIKEAAEKFLTAYFSGDKETLQDCLTDPYEWDIEVYAGTEAISNYTIKGLTTDINGEKTGNSKIVTVEYKNSENEDTFHYLTLEFVKQKEGWKIQFYGTEQ